MQTHCATRLKVNARWRTDRQCRAKSLQGTREQGCKRITSHFFASVLRPAAIIRLERRVEDRDVSVTKRNAIFLSLTMPIKNLFQHFCPLAARCSPSSDGPCARPAAISGDCLLVEKSSWLDFGSLMLMKLLQLEAVVSHCQWMFSESVRKTLGSRTKLSFTFGEPLVLDFDGDAGVSEVLRKRRFSVTCSISFTFFAGVRVCRLGDRVGCSEALGSADCNETNAAMKR